MAEGKQKTWKIERIIITIIFLIVIPFIIGVLFYIFLPFEPMSPMVRGGIAGALSIAITGLLLTIRGLPREGAFLINGGLMAFLVQYFISLSITVADPKFIGLFGLLTILLSSTIYLINIFWLGTREKIAHDLFLKLSKSGSIVFLMDSLIIITYISFIWWFRQIYWSLGLGLIIIGAILLIFRSLISSKKRLYMLIMLPMNVGLSLLIYGGVYESIWNPYIALFLTCVLGFSINLLINIIVYATTEIIPNIVWYKVFCLEFLCISIFGGWFFGFLFYFNVLLEIAIIILWFNILAFGTLFFGFKSEFFSLEVYKKLKLIAELGLGLEFPVFLTATFYNMIGPLIAVGIFGILLSLFNFRLYYKVAYYINSINLSWGIGVVVGTLIFLKNFEILNALFWAILIVNGLLIGVFGLGLARRFLIKKSFYQINFINWICLSIMIGLLIGGIGTTFQIFLAVLIGTLISSFSLLWAKAGELIGEDLFYKFYRLIGLIINIQLTNIFLFPILRYPANWIGYLAAFLIMFGLLNYFSLIRVREKRLIFLNHFGTSFGIFLLISWINAFSPFYFILSAWIGSTLFLIIIPIGFGINLASSKALYRLAFASGLFYIFLTTRVLYYLVSISPIQSIYLIIVLVSLSLFPVFYFGNKGELFSERISYGLSCATFNIFIVSVSFFLGTLLWNNIFYQITFILLFIFSLLVPDLYLLYRAKLIIELYYRKAVEFDENILYGILALILAGIPIVVSNNWALGIGIFFTIYGLLAGIVQLYHKKYSLFWINLLLFFSGFFWFLYNILIFIVFTPLTTVFWALFIDLFLILIILNGCKQRELMPLQKARRAITFNSISLNFSLSFLMGWYLQKFLPFAIISSIFVFLLLSRVIVIYIDSNRLFTESICKRLLVISKWVSIIADSLFFYILFNTLNPLPLTIGYQVFNVSLAIALFLGFSCAFSKEFREIFVKILTNRIFLTIATALLGSGIGALILNYTNDLFLGINLAILLILICWKAIFSRKFWGNYFIIGVPVVLGSFFIDRFILL